MNSITIPHTWPNPSRTDYPYLTKLKWNTIDRFQIEATMIRNGGKLRGYGEGIDFHYRAAIAALWPDFQWHRWAHLLTWAFAGNDEVAVLGPASSGKTYCAAAYALTTFFVWPTGTSIIMSSTTKEGLELRVWGAVKKLYNAARRKREFLPGHMIQSRTTLSGAPEDEEAKDFRDGIIGVACFLPGTMVDTPFGKIPIEHVRVGDSVLNASGVGVVTATHTRTARRILRITISDGRKVDCTEEHPFFTQRGWVKAIDLSTFDMVFSAHEGVRIMRGEFGWPVSESEVLLGSMPRFHAPSEVRGVRSGVQAHETPWEESAMERALLFEDLRRAMGSTSGIRFGSSENSEVQALRKGAAKHASQQEVLLRRMQERSDSDAVQALRQSVHLDQGIPLEASQHILQSILQAEWNDKEKAPHWIEAHSRGADCVENVSSCSLEPSPSEWNQEKERLSELVQIGCGVSGHSARCGSGRWRAPNSGSSSERREKNTGAGVAWVDRVEVLEPRSAEGTGASAGGYRVHNISVDGHPSYSVNGILVHNCRVGGTFVGISNYVGVKNDRLVLIADEASLMGRGFLDSLSNIRKGAKKRFQFICMGNPKDRTDALGVAAEPSVEFGGWEGYDGAARTQAWPTRAKRGIAIQICGYDSPNYDFPRGQNPWSGIITPEHIEADLDYYGENTLQFSMMNLGIMPKDASSRRVITMQIAEQRNCFDDVVWGSGKIFRGAGLDPAYRGTGGDRCVLTPFAFGEDRDGILRLLLSPQVIVPINPSSHDTPEEQIAIFCRDHCVPLGIAPENFGFDSTGRGSLAIAFAQLWSPDVVPVEFGGPAPDRAIRDGDTKKESEVYAKMVSALWFASYNVMETGQLRGVSRESVEEGCLREWGMTKNLGGKKAPLTDVEPKDKTKARMGRSPDLWDSVCVAIEVARRRGFVIRSGQAGIRNPSRKPPEWLIRLAQSHQKLRKEHSLVPV